MNLFQHLYPKNRCTLKIKNPLIADENRVVRQRSSAAEKIKTRSRNKFGMTMLGDHENITSRHSELDSESR